MENKDEHINKITDNILEQKNYLDKYLDRMDNIHHIEILLKLFLYLSKK